MPTASTSFFGWVAFLLQKYGMLFLRGTGMTLLIALTGTIFGFLIGLLVAIVRATSPMPSLGRKSAAAAVRDALLKAVQLLLGAYIQVFRGTPMIVQAVVNPFGTQALAGYAATMRVENVFSLIFVSIGNAVSPFVSQNLGAGKPRRIKKGYHAALVLDVCFAVLAFLVIETWHTQISSLFLGKDGTALAYQVSEDYMRWLGYFFIFMGIKMATDGVLRGLGIMRPFLVANMVNLGMRLSVALLCAPRFGIAFVWLAVPAGWLANFLVSYAALRKSWPEEKAALAQ